MRIEQRETSSRRQRKIPNTFTKLMMQRLSAILLIGFILNIGSVVNALLKNDTAIATNSSRTTIRSLQAANDFVPLSCNANVASASCGTWTSRFGSGATVSSRVIIPCGQCITMNHPGPSLTLQDGIDIQGKLVFPNTQANLIINTPLVVVQGLLEMRASKPVDGIPSIRFILTGGNEQTFTPVGSNANACGGGKCSVGKKSFTVAGGRLSVRGLPDNAPSWVKLRDVSTDLRTIVVDSTVSGKWAPGSEIVITSHTIKWDGHQVRTISKVTPFGSDGAYVSLLLSSAIDRPTTLRDSSDFAVEVALLSRNIVFQGGSDSTSLHGGHFWVMQTPKVQQYIEGIDFQNFGQQGLLGRYPIHFHLCGDVTGSVVIKNTVRLSNQRCIVVHGTDNLRIESNVAFNTKGHCFMLEDGIETGNSFIKNIGVMTTVQQRLIPNMGTNGVETDNSPATFWITNPTNTWTENVAAGSERSGFWFELLKRGPRASRFPNINPMHDSLTLFQNNVAHSNAVHGVKTYPSGYLPDEEASLIGIKAYLNSFGLFIHVSRNMVVQGGVFADNKVSVDIDRDELTTVDGAMVIGESNSYRQYLAAKQQTSKVCLSSHIGLELHTQLKSQRAPPIIIKDVSFSGFSHLNCANAVPIMMDGSTEIGLFDSFTTMEGVIFENSGDRIDFCAADLARIRDVYIIDLDGSLRPAGSAATSGTSSLVSDEPNMLSFVDSSKCALNQDNCHSYCRGTCFRTFRYQVEPAGGYQLKVCKSGSSSNCIFLSGVARTDDPTFAKRPREFIAHLPSGSNYDATFVTSSGAATWPSYVDTTFDPPLCPEALQTDAVRLIVPSITDTTCTNLIRNGDFQASSTATTSWLHNDGGITLVTGRGVGGSNAAAGKERISTTTFFQYIDNRCMDVAIGEFYELTASIKLINSDGSTFTCNPDRQACPDIGVHTNTGGFQRVATVTGSIQNGFQTATGFVQISSSIAAASQVAFFVRSNASGKLLIVDNVSMKRQESNCNNLIRASTMETDEWKSLWGRSIVSGSGGVYTAVAGYNSKTAIKYGQRKNSVEGPYYTSFRNIELQCLKPGTKWRISVQMKLINRSNGQSVSCNINQTTNPCPTIQISMRNGNRERFFAPILKGFTSTWNANSFNLFQADMTLPASSEWDGSLRTVEFHIRDFTVNYDLIVDNVSFAAA